MFSTQLLVLVVMILRTQGREAAVRALTIPQSTIKNFPGRQNQDIAEIQQQSAQAAEQYVQFIEAVYDPNFTDPDDLISLLSNESDVLHEAK